MPSRSFTGTASISLPVPPQAAMSLFTPEGERAWAGEGWDPQYADPARSQGPGAVFTTRHGSHETTWVMVDQAADRLRYARVTPGLLAGTVEVRIVGAGASTTTVSVTYDLTALGDEALPHLREFEAGYDDSIAAWAREIHRSLAGEG